MEENIYIYHHLGLGDHILCNGLVRSYAEKYKKLYLFVKPNNFKNVSYMFRDLDNIRFIQADMDQVNFFMQVSPDNNYLIAGHTPDFFQKLNEGIHSFDQGFYASANIPFEDKWNKFNFQRDLEKEKEAFYNKLKLKDGERFLFVHDSPEQGRNFKSSYISKEYKIINPGKFKDVGLFDFIYTIEKAKEIHVMNSSFMNLIDCMQVKTSELFYHEYSRPGLNPILKLNWKILK